MRNVLAFEVKTVGKGVSAGLVGIRNSMDWKGCWLILRNDFVT